MTTPVASTATAGPRIRVLPGPVADQIAAGEVVDRPASVVKELVENALDAGARTIHVTVEDGGRALISVADDGSGMTPADAVLALERHATSKIARADDLVGVATFGFRGEALPAIASVSEFALETAALDGAGTAVRGSGGVVRAVEEIARRRGTTVHVRQLFHNTPARRKFLKGARSEWRAIAELLAQIAVLRRDVHLVARHDGRVALDLPPAPSLRARLAALWPGESIGRFVDIDDVCGVLHVRGLVERPADVGTRARRLLLVVNGRVVRDAGLTRAAEAAYRSTLPAGLRPSLVLDLTLPATDVDVNVHPAKAEVRLHERWETERALEQIVRRALGTFDAAAGLSPWRWPPASAPEAGHTAARAGLAGDRTGVEQLTAPGWLRSVRATAPADGLFAAPASALGAGDEGSTATRPDGPGAPDPVEADTGREHPAPPPTFVPPLLQLRRTYLLFEHDEGVVLIDQHAAHERVLYERFLGQLAGGSLPAQRLLLPLTLHVSAAEADAYERAAPALAALGFEVEEFGGHTLLVQAVPLPHPRFDAERCLRDTLATLAGDRGASDAARHERLAATVACKAAIKAGDTLSPGEMRALYLDLARTTLPANDVHGRAVIVRLSWDELDRRFGRG